VTSAILSTPAGRVLRAVVSVAVVVAVFAFAVPKVASYSSAWAVLRQLSWACCWP
jgi:hypothetical protein